MDLVRGDGNGRGLDAAGVGSRAICAVRRAADGASGGAFTTFGAMLVLGAVPRFLGRPRWPLGLVLGAGASILVLTWPVEGAFHCAPNAAFLLYSVVQSGAVNRGWRVGRRGVRPESWSSGHRNVLLAALDARGRLWEVEMGPRGGGDLNRPERGKDYGWPTIGDGEEYSGKSIHMRTQSPAMEQLVYYWDPVTSPSGMAIYSGKPFPEWRGNIFIGGLSSKVLVRLTMKGDRVSGEERLLTERESRIREVVEGPDGALYLLTDSDNRSLLKSRRKDDRSRY